MTVYTATSLEDIAEHFERMADQCARQADRATAVGQRNLLNRESSTWTRAARMLRDTTIVPEEGK